MLGEFVGDSQQLTASTRENGNVDESYYVSSIAVCVTAEDGDDDGKKTLTNVYQRTHECPSSSAGPIDV